IRPAHSRHVSEGDRGQRESTGEAGAGDRNGLGGVGQAISVSIAEPAAAGWEVSLIFRRRFFPAIGAGMLTGCLRRLETEVTTRLFARPGEPANVVDAGAHPLGLRKRRDALLYVPK